ncbi:hypothetical protein Rsub_04930 [Raphidocelis subcapitata]|uniref:P-loop containing nucleoside triphosphate hydrolase protein n=1 Tax=Raphidocelis subcapitata TaxID=307507 RepID=A0A2V0P412_9CHLO|nr:hypothetical protein Rsub_04930 [Raphidocelis subcapitata]|eukprot:GBF91825.1 hypothetical protein Rsub_04930 [Raphidocelis subcapitata]
MSPPGEAGAAAALDAPPPLPPLPATPPRPVLLLVKGLPGSGKTSLARALARRLRWPLIDKDDARDCLQPIAAATAAATAAAKDEEPRTAGGQQQAASAGQSSSGRSAAAGDAQPQHQQNGHHHQQQQQQQQQQTKRQQLDCTPQPDSYPQPDWNALSYDIMFRFAATQLSLGLPVVLDCPFSKPQLYKRAQSLADQHGAAVALIDCLPSDEAAWRARLEGRGTEDAGTERGHKPCSWGDLQRLLDSYAGCWRWSIDAAPPLPRRFVADTTARGAGELAGAICGWLGAEGLLGGPADSGSGGGGGGQAVAVVAALAR